MNLLDDHRCAAHRNHEHTAGLADGPIVEIDTSHRVGAQGRHLIFHPLNCQVACILQNILLGTGLSADDISNIG